MNESLMMRVHKKFFELLTYLKLRTGIKRVDLTKLLADIIILSNSENDIEKYINNMNYKIVIIVNINSKRKIIDYLNKIL
ncbi:MAG: hypothetical protein QXP34_01850 [Candidatus Aenigmatarchaeota archaeon]